MGSLASKFSKNENAVEIHYIDANSPAFDFDGTEGWRINKEIERFSSDGSLEMEAEMLNSTFYYKKIGLSKIGIDRKRWRFNNT